MNILVTGGAGFIGTALIKRLVTEYPEADILCIDDFSTGKYSNQINNTRVRYLNVHTTETYRWEEPELIFHLGEYSRIATSFEDSGIVALSNVAGTINILELWKQSKAKLIYAGSSSIFADKTLSPYALSKAHNSEWIKQYAEWFGLDYAITYFYNVYGPGQLEDGRMATVIGIYEKCIRQGKALPVVTPGTQKRDFTHIDDVVNGIILAAKNGTGEYQLSTGTSYSIMDVVKAFDHPYELVEARRGERFDSFGHNTRAVNELGWAPKHNILKYAAQRALDINENK